MKTRVAGLLVVCAMFAQGAFGGLGYEVAWQVQGKGGFSGPNEIRDPATGRTKGFVVSEFENGIVCFTPDGRRAWEHAMVPPVTTVPTVADIDGDGAEEVVGCDSAGNIVVLTDTGELKWAARVPGGVFDDACPAVADLDRDGAPEILVGDFAGYVSCFDNTGTLLWRFQGEGEPMGPTLVADIYDAPGREIIVTSHDRHIYALTAKGEWLWDVYRHDDLFPNSTPIMADVEGDGIPELFVGGGLHHFLRIDLRSGRLVEEENVFLHVNSAISAADLDGDGGDEIVFGNKGGAVWCYGGDGFRWKREFPRSCMLAAPTLVNLDEDADLEIMLHSSTGDVQVLDADGTSIMATSVPCKPTSPPLVGDFDADGMMEAVVAGLGGSSDGKMVYVDLGVPYQADPRAWTIFAGNRAHTCRVPGASQFTLLATPAKTSEPSGASFASYGDQMLLTGSNVWRFDVANPGNERLVLTTDIVHPNGVVHRFAKHVRGAQQRVAVQFEASEPGAYGVDWKLVDADRRTVLSSSTASFSFEGLESDLAYLDGVLLKQTLAAAETWKQTNPIAAEHVRDELRTLRGTLATLKESGHSDRARSIPALRDSAVRLRALAVAGKALAPTGSFFAWESNPWAYFDAVDSLPAPENRTEQLGTALCVGEYESLALNLTNVSGRTLEVRVLSGDLVGEKTYPASDHLEFRRAVAVSSIRRERVADALPRLDQGRLITVPSHESQQLWITVNAVGMEPGDYVSKLRLKSVEPDPTEVAIPIEVKVWDLALARPRPLRFCLWSYDSGPLGVNHEYALKDLVDHGVTVFFGPAPSATCDAEGRLVGELDFTKHDESVRLLSPHGIMLFISPQGSLRGQPFLSEPWRKAFVSYLRAWVSHMKELGMDYDRYALYPYDEPSTPYAETTVNLVEVAKLVREADPNILIYTDPTSGTTMETVKMFTGLIDIWCPSSELLERLGDELVPEAKRVGKEVWFYDASGRSRTLSCLGLYRWRFWYAWNLGFTGAGWWTYATHSEDLWDGPNPTGDYFATVYDGEGVVSSKRWEVAREGVEDYEILYLLRDAIQRARERGVSGSVVGEAERLLEELPRRVEATLHETGRRLPLTPDSVPVYEQATDIIQDARRQIVEMCVRLNRQESS